MLAVTLGDPYSVNIELISRVIAEPASLPVVLIGSRRQWEMQRARLGLPRLDLPAYAGEPVPGISFLNVTHDDDTPADEMSPMQRGKMIVDALNALTDLPVASVLTMPIDKHAASCAGFDFPGHTEFFEKLWGERAVMVLAGDRLRVGLVTNHVALHQVAEWITPDLIIDKTERFAATLRDVFGVAAPRIAITGLNPHAGDQGLFGGEEEVAIKPAIATLLSRGYDVSGPRPADTAFAFACRGEYDGVLAMYHDQGLGPLKVVHFDDAVNVSGGLPKLRVSPDHGPAADLYLQGRAIVDSTAAAWRLACKAVGASL